MYVCGRCSAKRTLAGMRRDPCKECPKGLTNAEWQRSAHGKAQVDTPAAKRAITRGHKKQKAWRKTEEGRIYFQDKMRIAIAANKKLFAKRSKGFRMSKARSIRFMRL